MALRRLVFDIETDSLKPTVMWCACVIDIDTKEEFVYESLTDFCNAVDKFAGSLWCGHGAINFDIPALRRLAGREVISPHRVVDTLVCSRLFDYTRAGGHSLKQWGIDLKLHKGDFNEWEAYADVERERSRRMRCAEYCLQDCRITAALFRRFEKFIFGEAWRRALNTEHETAIICEELHENGFRFDYEGAQAIQRSLSAEVERISSELRQAFPDRPRPRKLVTPRATKFGTLSKADFRWFEGDDLSAFTPEHPFTVLDWVPFNPGSPKQVVEILNAAGWMPTDKTKGYKLAEKELSKLQRIQKPNPETILRISSLEERLKEYAVYGWQISEENLETVPEGAPEGIKSFVRWRMLSKRLQTLQEWLQAYNPVTHAIHGEFAHIGTWTHRKAHSKPNQGNVPSVDSKYHAPELKALARQYGQSMRGLFTVGKGEALVGTDADGIQLRILAHYMDDAEFTEALVNGDKDKGTDAHTLNAEALGIGAPERSRAKTFIYAWLLGAGTSKVGKILNFSNADAAAAVEGFIRRYPGLYTLKHEIIPTDARRGYFRALDGRLIKSDEYHMLAGYLQSGESIIMKEACIIWRKELKRSGIWFKQVNDVHDEWQTVCRDDERIKKEVGRVQVEAIVTAGVNLGLRCPLAGTAKFGLNWYETH